MEDQQDPPPRKPAAAAVGPPVKTKVFVGHIPEFCYPRDLEALFSRYGTVVECDILKNYGFVHMSSAEEADAAIDALNNFSFRGARLSVEASTSTVRQKPRANGYEGGPRPYGGGRGRGRGGPPRGPPRDDYYGRPPPRGDPYDMGYRSASRMHPYERPPAPYSSRDPYRRSPPPSQGSLYRRRSPPPPASAYSRYEDPAYDAYGSVPPPPRAPAYDGYSSYSSAYPEPERRAAPAPVSYPTPMSSMGSRSAPKSGYSSYEMDGAAGDMRRAPSGW